MTLQMEAEGIVLPEGLEAYLDRIAQACICEEGVENAYAYLRIVTEEEIREVNARTRGIDKVTDVLSFPSVKYRKGTARDNSARLRRQYDPETGKVFLGDFLICLKRAREQAQAFNHSLGREIGYLTCHAMYHLMGYDHMTETDKRVMRAMEDATMDHLGITRTVRDFEEGSAVTDQQLFEKACEALTHAYAPYSKFRVGACILTDTGNTYWGANIENASYGATICAERAAVSKAVTADERKFVAIAVVGEFSAAWPCGICRQVLNEFSDDMRVICGPAGGTFEVVKLSELLPHSFGPKDLNI